MSGPRPPLIRDYPEWPNICVLAYRTVDVHLNVSFRETQTTASGLFC